MKKLLCATLVASLAILAGCLGDGGSNPGSVSTPTAKNVIFFLGDGMGITTMTAARIYKVGEDGDLTMDTLPETAFVKTYSNNAQVTDSAPSMSAYMTGVKMNNEVISMTAATNAFDAQGKDYFNGFETTCPSGNGQAVTTLLELAKIRGRSVGAVTTTRITHATPAATYSHICHRDAENTIAAQLVPGGTSFNGALLDGVDVVMGGGRKHFLPTSVSGGARIDNRNLVDEMKSRGYAYASNKSEFDSIQAGNSTKLLGLFSASHMSYDLDRSPALEPSLAEMTSKAIDILSKNSKGFFLMVEGGRIDHALHETTARKALQDTVAFDDAIKTALDKMRLIDPNLSNTIIVVTADHDHTLVLNGYAKRTGPTSEVNPGVLGLLKNVVTGALQGDANGSSYTIIGFGNGENRPLTRGALSDAQVYDKSYHQEAAIPMAVGSETHGGADVFLGAIGNGSDKFFGVIDNNTVFDILRGIAGL